jgi:hypothetical protein
MTTTIPTKYSTEALAHTNLIYHKKPDCVEALEREFWQALNVGLNYMEAYFYAELTHAIRDHEALNHEETLEDRGLYLSTDDDVYAYSANGVLESAAKGEDSQHLADAFVHWYDRYRSWGGDIFLSYYGAARIVTEIWEEESDANEAEAIDVMETNLPAELLDIALAAFRSTRARGETVRASARAARDASLKGVLGGLFGGISD